MDTTLHQQISKLLADLGVAPATNADDQFRLLGSPDPDLLLVHGRVDTFRQRHVAWQAW